MKKLLLLIFFSPMFVTAQDTTVSAEEPVLVTVEQMPEFKGDIYQYLTEHIKYPENEKKNNISGMVYVTFIVEKNGTLSDVRIIKGVPNGPGLNVEAMKVVRGMPRWTSGQQKGKNVRVQYNLPIRFELK